MSCKIKWILALGLSMAAHGAIASLSDFSRYDVILQRKPFGEPVVAPPPSAVNSLVPPPDSFIKNLRMCAIINNPEGTRVGLVDLTAKPPKSYFLYVGDAEDGIALVQADYAAEKALLRKGAEEYWISMNEASIGGGGAVIASATTASGMPRPSYAERLRQRREEEEARLMELKARAKLSPAALEKKLQQHQMEAIRNGDPPLPIPLTPEMDDQLVQEGVLPPTN